MAIPKDSMQDQRMLVTGAASGIGAAVVTAAAEAGAEVIALDVQDAAGT